MKNTGKKLLLSLAVILAFIGYAFRQRHEAGTVTSNTSIPSQPPIGSTSNFHYRDGLYTGSVTDAFYGYVQVQATISGGQITAVKFLRYPNDRSTSVRINAQAMPLLQQEAIQTQNANVSGVSGASATSGAFIQSLQSALSQAGA